MSPPAAQCVSRPLATTRRRSALSKQYIHRHIVVNQTPPEEKKTSTKTGESALPGHLAAEEGDEVAGSDSFVPKDKKDDKQLLYAIDLLNGARKDAAYLGTGRTSSAMAN